MSNYFAKLIKSVVEQLLQNLKVFMSLLLQVLARSRVKQMGQDGQRGPDKSDVSRTPVPRSRAMLMSGVTCIQTRS